MLYWFCRINASSAWQLPDLQDEATKTIYFTPQSATIYN